MNFINPVQTVANSLPNKNPVIVLDKISPNGKEKVLIVHQKIIHTTLSILKQLNQFYANISINSEMTESIAAQGECEL